MEEYAYRMSRTGAKPLRCLAQPAPAASGLSSDSARVIENMRPQAVDGWADPRLSSAKRVGILDHIWTAAGGRTRGEQHKAFGGEYPAREIAPQREIIGDILAGGVVEARQRNVRNEFAPLRVEADALH